MLPQGQKQERQINVIVLKAELDRELKTIAIHTFKAPRCNQHRKEVPHRDLKVYVSHHGFL